MKTEHTIQSDKALAADFLIQNKLMLTTAESCTGGLIAAACTDLAGSSAWFERGFVTYSNAAKTDLLGVPAALIEQHGAVSEAVVRAMVQGALAHSHAQAAVAVTGVAGPSGGSPDKPVGTVWIGWLTPGGGAGAGAVGASGTASAFDTATLTTECCHFPGDRAAVRQATVAHAFHRLAQLLAR